MSTVTIAPHLLRALEAMSKDMAVEPQALVNQAVFAWLRINGYVTPGAPVAVAAPAAVVAPVAAVAPVTAAPVPPAPPPEPIAPPAPAPAPAPPPMSSTPTPAPIAPPPAAPVVAAPVEAKKSAPDTSGARARIAEIAADLEKLTRPWPEWTKAEDEEEEDEKEGEEDEGEEDDEPAEEPPADEEEASEDDEEAAGDEPGGDEPAEEEAPRAAEPELDANTGETEVAPPEEEEPPAESTVVLRSVPIVLYLEREGEEPVRVTAERFIIGRGPQCDLIIDSPRVSREHLVVTRQGVRYFIEDLNSSNGTWFGEERVTTRELESGDVINLGNEPVTFWLRGE